MTVVADMLPRTGNRQKRTVAHKGAVNRNAWYTLNQSDGWYIPGKALKLATMEKTRLPMHTTGGTTGWQMTADMPVHIPGLQTRNQRAAAGSSEMAVSGRSQMRSGMMMQIIDSQALLLLLMTMSTKLVHAERCVLLMPAANSGMSAFLNTAIHCWPVAEHSKTTQMSYRHSTNIVLV